MTVITDVIAYFISFLIIWWGAGQIIRSVDKIARKLKISSFAVSFFVLGIMTSIPEIALSFGAVSEHNPGIFVGTLLGGVVVIFLLVIPVLAILGKGISIKHHLDNRTLILALVVMAAPGFLVIDQKVTNPEGLFLVVSYLLLFYIIQRKHGIFDKEKTDIMQIKAYSFIDLVRVVSGIAAVFIASNYIVDQTIAFSHLLGVPTFYISLLALSLGTNLPELSLAVTSIFSGKQDIAFGDYLGSASANTLLFGFFTLLNDGEVITSNSFMGTFIFIAFSLILFYIFSKSNKIISVKEGYVMLTLYLMFIIYEISFAAMFHGG